MEDEPDVAGSLGTQTYAEMEARARGLALALDGRPGIDALAADTDGIDGSRDNAGAFIGPDTLRRAVAAGLDARTILSRNDAYTLFARLGALFVTGPTLTNVNDLRAILIAGADRP